MYWRCDLAKLTELVSDKEDTEIVCLPLIFPCNPNEEF